MSFTVASARLSRVIDTSRAGAGGPSPTPHTRSQPTRDTCRPFSIVPISAGVGGVRKVAVRIVVLSEV